MSNISRRKFLKGAGVAALAETVSFKTIQDNVPADLKDYEFESTEDKKIPADGVVVIKMHKKAAAKPMKKVTIEYTTGTSEVISTDFKFYELETNY